MKVPSHESRGSLARVSRQSDPHDETLMRTHFLESLMEDSHENIQQCTVPIAAASPTSRCYESTKKK